MKKLSGGGTFARGRREHRARFIVNKLPFQHLTIDQVREFLRVAESGGELIDVLDQFSVEAKEELAGLGLYGKSKQPEMGYTWHLEHITEGGYHTEWSSVDVRIGAERLGLGSELDSR